jgi:hypothetical protein
MEQYRPVITYWSISMSAKYPFIPDHLERGLEDLDIPLIDLMHGHLKIEMVEVEEAMDSNPDRFLEGYMQALTNMYALTYNLSIDRANLERTPHE